MRSPVLAAVAVVILAAGISCAPQGDRRERSSGGEIRPLIAGLWVGSGALDTAEDRLVRRCMTRHGFSVDTVVARIDREMPRPFGDDVGKARREGFRVAERLADPSRSEAEYLRLTDADAARWQTAMQGPPTAGRVTVRTIDGYAVTETTSGCVGQARAEIYGSVVEGIALQQLRDNTIPKVLESSADDPTVTVALSEWSRCMAGRGHRAFGHRNDARASAERYYDRYDRAAAGAREREVAVDDAECDGAAGYTRVRLAAEDAALAEFMSRHEDAVIRLLRTHRQSVDRSARVLAAG
jgi:hypothetical protein